MKHAAASASLTKSTLAFCQETSSWVLRLQHTKHTYYTIYHCINEIERYCFFLFLIKKDIAFNGSINFFFQSLKRLMEIRKCINSKLIGSNTSHCIWIMIWFIEVINRCHLLSFNFLFLALIIPFDDANIILVGRLPTIWTTNPGNIYTAFRKQNV